MKTTQLATLCFICLLGVLPGAAYAQPYTISTDGSEVTDQATGLVWRRCAEGLVGSACTTGTALTFIHNDAVKRAVTVSSSTATAWRLPNVKELASIADKSLLNPAIDATAFPATPAGFFWSSSPAVFNATNAWTVDFYYGTVAGSPRSTNNYVRLVRAGQ